MTNIFFERLNQLCEEKGTTPNPLLTPLGISSGTITRWKEGVQPTGKFLIIISDALGCSIDYLLGRTDNPQSHTDKEILSSDEQDLLEIYRNFNDKGKVALKTQAGILSTVPLYTKENQMNWWRMLWETFMKLEQWNLKTLKNI